LIACNAGQSLVQKCIKGILAFAFGCQVRMGRLEIHLVVIVAVELDVQHKAAGSVMNLRKEMSIVRRRGPQKVHNGDRPAALQVLLLEQEGVEFPDRRFGGLFVKFIESGDLRGALGRTAVCRPTPVPCR